MLALFRAVLRARHDSPALQLGRLELLDAPAGVLAYRRIHGDDERVVAINFGAESAVVDATGTVVVRSDGMGAGDPFTGDLAGEHAVILEP